MAISPLPIAGVKQVMAQRAEKLERFFTQSDDLWRNIPDRLREAMQYSLYAGGKRVRPVLCLTWASAAGIDEDSILPFAAAIEMIHTYSLIHDDLPAMDNDDYRRGKLSNHKRFDEATAILAGDGLLTDAFALACKANVPARDLLAAICELAGAAGAGGMAGGQMLDMLYTGKKDIGLEEIKTMQAMKTGAMIACACVCGAMVAGADDALIRAARKYGIALGRAFQIKDDILDITGDEKLLGKPVGSDRDAGKNTYPALIGIERSEELAQKEASAAVDALLPCREAEFLAGLAEYVVSRSK